MRLPLPSSCLHRQYGVSRFSTASSAQVKGTGGGVDKTALMQLRRKTGFSFVNCKEALVKFGSDLNAAEKWLMELAVKEGWEKATKLGNRRAVQGLIGVFASNNIGAMIEVNCETDFVGRNERFRELVVTAANSCFDVAKSRLPVSSDSDKWELPSSDLSQLLSSNGTPLAELIAFTTGQVGEKLQLSRAVCMSVRDGAEVFGYSHPRGTGAVGGVTLGHYGTLVALQRSAQSQSFPSQKLGEQLCQQIVGMNPKSLGSPMSPEEKEMMRRAVRAAEENRRRAEELASPLVEVIGGDEQPVETTQADQVETTLMSDETQLLRQDFLLHPDLTVAEYLRLHGATVLDFVRFECGEGGK